MEHLETPRRARGAPAGHGQHGRGDAVAVACMAAQGLRWATGGAPAAGPAVAQRLSVALALPALWLAARSGLMLAAPRHPPAASGAAPRHPRAVAAGHAAAYALDVGAALAVGEAAAAALRRLRGGPWTAGPRGPLAGAAQALVAPLLGACWLNLRRPPRQPCGAARHGGPRRWLTGMARAHGRLVALDLEMHAARRARARRAPLSGRRPGPGGGLPAPGGGGPAAPSP